MEAVELQVIGAKAPSEIGGTRAIPRRRSPRVALFHGAMQRS
jgi:hypothetical protein